jgi:hypothetical protein
MPPYLPPPSSRIYLSIYENVTTVTFLGIAMVLGW